MKKAEQTPEVWTPPRRITVAGVSFGADDVIEAKLKIDGREVFIGKVEEDKKPVGFAAGHK